MRAGHRDLIRDLNRTLVLNLVREQPRISRAQIARRTGLSPSTVTSITASLLADELLVEDDSVSERGERSGSVGRPATMLRIDPAARHVAGVKLAPASLTAVVTDLDAEPQALVTLPHAESATSEQIIELLGEAMAQLRARAGLADERLLGLGVGVPGSVDPVTADVRRSPLPGWVEADLAGTLERRLGVPVLIDNDVNTFTVAEHLYGAGRGVDDLLVVTIGRGIGMGAVVDGAIARGSSGALGEIGHIESVAGGHRCWCGKRGCLEAEAAEPAIVREVLTTTGVSVSPDEMAEAAADDERVASILQTAGHRIGVAVGLAATLLDPARVVVSGEGVRLGPAYTGGIRDGIAASLLPEAEPELVFEPWGDEAWARGAASLVLRELFTPDHLRAGRRPAAERTKGTGERTPTVAR